MIYEIIEHGKEIGWVIFSFHLFCLTLLCIALLCIAMSYYVLPSFAFVFAFLCHALPSFSLPCFALMWSWFVLPWLTLFLRFGYLWFCLVLPYFLGFGVAFVDFALSYLILCFGVWFCLTFARFTIFLCHLPCSHDFFVLVRVHRVSVSFAVFIGFLCHLPYS